jgi:hypothetical protein
MATTTAMKARMVMTESELGRAPNEAWRFPGLDRILFQPGGDNLAAAFSMCSR